MERLKAGYEKFREAKGHLLNEAAGPVMQKFIPSVHGRQHSIAGRSVIESRQISEGGFAFVWLVHDAKTNEELVLKKIRCQDKSSFMMAQREIQLLERLPQHPNLVRYYGDVLLTEGKCREVGLLFEFCSGGHLLHFLDKHEGKLSEKLIVHTLSEVVAGVAVLHSFLPPVQHRDLKVENVLRGSDGHWKLLDFGSWSDECLEPGTLDKPALSALQEQIDKYTTMIYRPPEMVDFYAEFPISEKVDVWMIGCILYTLMFYRHPFQDESPLAIANARYPWPATPEHSNKLRDLTHWLLARDPTHRPDTAALLSLLVCFDEAEVSPPRPVLEKSEKLRKLYEPTGKSSREPSSPSAGDTGSDAIAGEGERKRSKPHKHRQGSKKRTEKVQAEALTDEGWPVATGSSELQWANFDGFHQEPSSAGSATPNRSEPLGAWAHFDVEPQERIRLTEPAADPWSAWSSPTHEPSTGSHSPAVAKVSHATVKPEAVWAAVPGTSTFEASRPDRWPLDSQVTAWPELDASRPLWDAGSPASRQRPNGASAPDSPKAAAVVWPQVTVTSPKALASDLVTTWPCASPWTNTPAGSPRSGGDPGSPGKASPWPVAGPEAQRWPAEQNHKGTATLLPAPADPWSAVLSPPDSPNISPKVSRSHGQRPAFAWAAFD